MVDARGFRPGSSERTHLPQTARVELQFGIRVRGWWMRQEAKTANRKRRDCHPVGVRITGEVVQLALDETQGRCRYCGSLAVQRRPSVPHGAPVDWGNVGRASEASSISSPVWQVAQT